MGVYVVKLGVHVWKLGVQISVPITNAISKNLTFNNVWYLPPDLYSFNDVLLPTYTAASAPSNPLPTPSFISLLENLPSRAQTLLKPTVPLLIAASFYQHRLPTLQNRRGTTLPRLHRRTRTLSRPLPPAFPPSSERIH
jgi:hypothetical protein